MTIRAVCFDLDLTLLQSPDFDGATEVACRTVTAIESRISVQDLTRANQETFESIWPTVEDRFNAGILEGDVISRDIWARSLKICGLEDDRLLNPAFEAFFAHVEGSFQLYEDARAILDALAGQVPLALITNGSPRTQRRKIELSGIEPAFKAVLISGAFGAAKPDVRIFHRASALLNVEPDEMLHVGDNLEADVAGALGAGMTAVWLNREGRHRDDNQPEPDHEITTLAELPGLLDG